MRKSRFTEEQIVAALKLAQTSSVDEICRKLGNQQADVLRLEEEVRRHGRERRAAAQAARGGESPPEEAGRGPGARQRDAEGGSHKRFDEVAHVPSRTQEGAMDHIGIDLGGKESQVCARSPEGAIRLEGRWPTARIGGYLRECPSSRVVLETCAEAFAIADAV